MIVSAGEDHWRDRVGFRTQQISNLSIGDPANPDLTVRRAVIQLRIKWNGSVEVYRIVARGVRLRGRVVGGPEHQRARPRLDHERGPVAAARDRLELGAGPLARHDFDGAAIADELVHMGGQLAVLGTGDAPLEHAFLLAAGRNPGQIAVDIGYDETLAHSIIAGADVILVPSRFEPCGLTQLYGLRYGTLPLVHRVGGLADTVVDATPQNLEAGRATGIAFDEFSAKGLRTALRGAQSALRGK